jgi:hypothetical protein
LSSIQGSSLIVCPETSVRNYYSTLRKITKKKAQISFTVRRKPEFSQIYLSLVLQPAAILSALFYITGSKTDNRNRMWSFFKISPHFGFWLFFWIN